MTLNIGINGFGRIGRSALRYILESRIDMRVIKINASGSLESNAHLLKYDSVHGRLNEKISTDGQFMSVGNHVPIQFQNTRYLRELDWSDVDIVLECTGNFNDGDECRAHIKAGAKKVLISAPAKNVDRTIVYGVNNKELLAVDKIVSNGSCTTNCLAPIIKTFDNFLNIHSGIMTTIHSYTGDQPTLDRRHEDLYRGRAAQMSMIPTTTGAAKAIGQVIPSMKGKLDGTAIRVPTPNVSAIDLTMQVDKGTLDTLDIKTINYMIREASETYMEGVISYDEHPKVSIDFNHTEESCIFAPQQTKVVGNLVRVFCWYDNEWAFACRMADVAKLMEKRL